MRSALTLLCAGAIAFSMAPPASALDNAYQARLRGAVPVSVGQDQVLAGAITSAPVKKGSSKFVTKLAPHYVRIESFGIDNPQGDCRGTVEFPNYCDDIRGGYIPTYKLSVAVENRGTVPTDAVIAEIICSNSSLAATDFQLIATSPVPSRSRAGGDFTMRLPADIKSPADCAQPVVLVKSTAAPVPGSKGKKYPYALYLPVSLQ